MLRPGYPLEAARLALRPFEADELVYAMFEDEWRARVSGGRPG